MEQKLKIAVFIDFDNIEIGVKSTLQPRSLTWRRAGRVEGTRRNRHQVRVRELGRQESATALLPSTAVQMVQRDPSPRGDKNGADINLVSTRSRWPSLTTTSTPTPSSAAIATSSRWSTS